MSHGRRGGSNISVITSQAQIMFLFRHRSVLQHTCRLSCHNYFQICYFYFLLIRFSDYIKLTSSSGCLDCIHRPTSLNCNVKHFTLKLDRCSVLNKHLDLTFNQPEQKKKLNLDGVEIYCIAGVDGIVHCYISSKRLICYYVEILDSVLRVVVMDPCCI